MAFHGGTPLRSGGAACLSQQHASVAIEPRTAHLIDFSSDP